MSTVRVTILLRTGVGEKPYRTCYFSDQELKRLQEDLDQYQKSGEPKDGLYFEEVTDGDEAIYIEFSAISQIKVSQKE